MGFYWAQFLRILAIRDMERAKRWTHKTHSSVHSSRSILCFISKPISHNSVIHIPVSFCTCPKVLHQCFCSCFPFKCFPCIFSVISKVFSPHFLVSLTSTPSKWISVTFHPNNTLFVTSCKTFFLLFCAVVICSVHCKRTHKCYLSIAG